MIYDRHPELQSKWNKAFWTRGYYVATVGNVTEDAIKKYIQEQLEESRKEDSEGATGEKSFQIWRSQSLMENGRKWG